MKKIETNNGPVYIVDAPYWAGEHSFTHYSGHTANDRRGRTELWSIDIYTRRGLDPYKHDRRAYIWANGYEDAANEAGGYVGNGNRVLLTHIVPLDDRLKEPTHSSTY